MIKIIEYNDNQIGKESQLFTRNQKLMNGLMSFRYIRFKSIYRIQ